MPAEPSVVPQTRGNQSINLAIAATFTAEPLAETLTFWLTELEISGTLEFAPYNQVFQQLLSPSSLFSSNQQGVNIICLRVEDWCRFNQTDDNAQDLAALFKRNAQDFVTALKAAVNRTSTPYILCLCPPSSHLHTGVNPLDLVRQTEAWITDSLKGIGGLHLIEFQDIRALYPVDNYYDPQRDQLGHIPFTPDFFTALGTAIARKIYAIKHPPHKVIVLDCDNTLWSGVVGEDGIQGIDLSPTWQAIQAFMVQQQQAGMLLCLCSKNNEPDVLQVFEQRQDMVLKLNHLVAWRINWLPKSENIQSLAAELNLGLDSFIFIDDNPVECAEVRANCPEVLTLQLPIESDVQQFLNHLWAFDHLHTTEEDTHRTVLYQQNLERQRFQQQTMTMESFLSGLEMTIAIEAMTAAQLSRVAQLTQRTNQFNFTTIRRTEAELQQLIQAGTECRTVTVRDRFGDYGLVGVMLFSHDSHAVNLDSFLLSCRVLGRGVEHQMVRYLGQYADEHGLSQVRLNYVPTPKNYPALRFLETIAKEQQQADGNGYSFPLPAQIAAAVIDVTDKGEVTSSSPTDAVPAAKASARPAPTNAQISTSQRLGRIAKELYSPQAILSAIQSQRQTLVRTTALNKPWVAPQSATEKELGALWSELLGVQPIGLQDNYFDLGGTSIQAVELFAKIEQYFGKRLPLTDLLEAPTLQQLAQLLDANLDRDANLGQAKSLVMLNTAETKTPPLFLIHPGGGEVLLYRNLAQRLQSTTAVYGIRPHSRNGYSTLHTCIPKMAADYIEQIRAIQPEGPYLLGGFCSGGVVAFEMALQLQAKGFSVPLVALMNSMDALERQKQKQAVKGSGRLKIAQEDLTALGKALLYKCCKATFPRAPKFIQNRSPYNVLTVAADTYNPKGKFQGKLWVFKSQENILKGHLRKSHYSPDPLLGWGTRTTDGVQIFENEGAFQAILQEPYVQGIAEELATYIQTHSLHAEQQVTSSLSPSSC